MGVVKNIGLFILLAAFGVGGYFVRDMMITYDELKSYREDPDYASLPEGVRVRLEDGEETAKELRKELEDFQEMHEEEVATLKEEVADLKDDNAVYFEQIRELEVQLASAQGQAPEEATTQSGLSLDEFTTLEPVQTVYETRAAFLEEVGANNARVEVLDEGPAQGQYLVERDLPEDENMKSERLWFALRQEGSEWKVTDVRGQWMCESGRGSETWSGNLCGN